MWGQNDYSFNLGTAGLEFVKLSSNSRLILLNRQTIIVAPNIIKINMRGGCVYGERAEGNDRFFVLFIKDLSTKHFSEFMGLEDELKKNKIFTLDLLEPGVFAKTQKSE